MRLGVVAYFLFLISLRYFENSALTRQSTFDVTLDFNSGRRVVAVLSVQDLMRRYVAAASIADVYYYKIQSASIIFRPAVDDDKPRTAVRYSADNSESCMLCVWMDIRQCRNLQRIRRSSLSYCINRI